MKKIFVITLISILSYSTFGQIVKKMPYEFDNTVTLDSTLIINDSVKISASGFSYGQYIRVDSNNAGDLILKTVPLGLDTLTDVNLTSPVNNQVLKYIGSNWVNAADSVISTLPYDSITSAPWTETPNGWRASDSTDNISIGGQNDTSTASLYVKSGIARRIFDLGDGNTSIDGSRGDIFQVSANTSPTVINAFTDIEQGRLIILLGRSSGNTSTIATTPEIILTGASPLTLDDNVSITFISCLDAGGNLVLLELTRN